MSDPASPRDRQPIDPAGGEALSHGLDARDSRSLAEALIDTANAIVVALDEAGTIVEFNRAAEAITGYSRTELAGRNWFEVICPRERYPDVWREFERLSSGGFPRTFENPILTKAGDERYILWSNSEWQDERGKVSTISFGIDMTEQRVAARERAETVALLGSIIEGTPDAIFAKDLDGKYVLVNSTAARILGRPKEQMMGEHDRDLFPKKSVREYEEGDRRVIETGESFSYEEDVPAADGTWLHRVSSKGPIRDDAGNLVGVFGIARDVTESWTVEDALARVARENAQLATAGMALVGCRSEDEVFDVVEGFFTEVVCDALTVVNQSTNDGASFITRRVIGVDETLLAKAAKLIGFQVVGRRFPITDEYRRKFFSATLVKVPGGFSELAGSEVPRSVIKVMESTFGIYDAYTIGIAEAGAEFGSIHIITRAPGVEPPARIIDAFARQCLLALSAIARTTEIAENAESQRCLIESMSEGLALHEMILDANGRPRDYRFLLVNPAFEQITGLKASEIVGRTALEVIPDLESFWIERYGAVAASGIPDAFEAYAKYPNKFFSVTAYSPGPNQFASLLSDASERKKTESELSEYRERLEALLAERERSVEVLALSFASLIDVVSHTVEMRDPYTAGHQRRVAMIATRIARQSGMSDSEVEDIRVAALLHDVGKLSVPSEILSKPGGLSRIEFGLVQHHAEAGHEIIKSARMREPIAELIYQHHERCDGSGYPRGLHSSALLPGAKVLMVADVLEAMASHRPYRPALGMEAAIEEITRNAGGVYDQNIVDACVAVVRDGFDFDSEET